MKVFAVPIVVAGLTAALSVVFFTGLSHVVGDALLGRIILVQSAAAIMVVACVPQSWAYLIGSRDTSELIVRYRHGLTAEMLGILVGATLIACAEYLPFPDLDRWRDGALIIYGSLAIQGMGSCMGWLRAKENWIGYALWALGPNLVRVPLVWATPALVSSGALPQVEGRQALAMALYFLVPDLVRLIAIAVPVAVRNYKWPGFWRTAIAVRVILKNWLFDIGSNIADNSDKIVVGAFLGPKILVVYFFARRIGIGTTMLTEPYYAEHYRRATLIKEPTDLAAAQSMVYKKGLVLSALSFVAITGTLVLLMPVPMIGLLLPNAVTEMFTLFVGVLLFDFLLAANRWSRYITQFDNRSVQLLLARILLFGAFAGNVWTFGAALNGLGLVLALGLSWLLEAIYVTRQIGRSDSRPSDWGPSKRDSFSRAADLRVSGRRLLPRFMSLY